MGAIKKLTVLAALAASLALPVSVSANTALMGLNTSGVQSMVKKAPTQAMKKQLANTLNKKLPISIEPGATLKNVSYGQNFELTIHMTDKTAQKYSSDETDSLNRFNEEKLHAFYCRLFNKVGSYAPDLYVNLVDKKGSVFFGSAEAYQDVCVK